MSVALRVSLLVGILVYLIVIIVLLRRKSLNLKYSLLWLFIAAILLLMVCFPEAVSFLARLLGVVSPINAIFLAFISFILLLLISLTAIASGQQRKIKTLIQNIAILQKQVEDLKNNK